MLSTILDKIKERLETIDDLTVLYDVKQIEKTKSPYAVINLVSQTPSGNDSNWKYSTKYKVNLYITIELVHTSLLDLLDLIEDAESALNISQKLNNTIEWDYLGWNKADIAIGSNVYGSQLNLSVIYIKSTE